MLARPPVAFVVSEHEWSNLSFESVLGPSGYAVLRAYTGQQAIERLQAVTPDVVFIDARLPDMDGVQLCRAIRKHRNISLSTPILLISSDHLTREQQLGALRAGVWELVRLPTDAEQLLLRLETYLAAKHEADRAREESLVDHGTGLYSMRGLLRRAREIASEAARYQRPLACIVVAPEMDDDGAPSEFAANMAAAMAEVFRATNRTSDAVGRLGPQEFVLLAPETDEAGARRLAERLLEAFDLVQANAANLASGAPALPPIRVRMGGYAVQDFRSESIEPTEMLTRATLALRRSQEGGGPDGIQFYGNSTILN